MIKNFETYINEDYFSKLANRKDNGTNRKGIRGPKGKPVYYEGVTDKDTGEYFDLPLYDKDITNFDFNLFYCPNNEDIYGGYADGLDLEKRYVCFIDKLSSSYSLADICEMDAVKQLANDSGFFNLEDLDDKMQTRIYTYEKLGIENAKRYIGKVMVVSSWTSYDLDEFNKDVLYPWFDGKDFIKDAWGDWLFDGVAIFEENDIKICLPAINYPGNYDVESVKIKLIKNIIKTTVDYYIKHNM